MDLVGIVDQSVKQGIGYSRIPYDLMPVFYGKLACDNGRGSPVPVFDHFQEISTFTVRQCGKPLSRAMVYPH